MPGNIYINLPNCFKRIFTVYCRQVGFKVLESIEM